MANSDTLLLWVLYLQVALFLGPGLVALIGRLSHRNEKEPGTWSGKRMHAHP